MREGNPGASATRPENWSAKPPAGVRSVRRPSRGCAGVRRCCRWCARRGFRSVGRPAGVHDSRNRLGGSGAEMGTVPRDNCSSVTHSGSVATPSPPAGHRFSERHRGHEGHGPAPGVKQQSRHLTLLPPGHPQDQVGLRQVLRGTQAGTCPGQLETGIAAALAHLVARRQPGLRGQPALSTTIPSSRSPEASRVPA